MSAAPAPAFQDIPQAKAWLSRQPLANPQQLQAALSAEIAHLNQWPLAGATRLQLMEFLRETVHFAQDECAKRYAGRALPLAPSEQTSFDASRGLWQLMADGYRLCLDAIEAGDAILRQQAALISQRALLAYACLQFDCCRAQHDFGSTYWQGLHRLYATADRLGCAEREVEDSLKIISRQATPSSTYALSLLLYAAGPFELSLRQVTAVRRWLARWCGKVMIHRLPVPAGEAAPFVIDLTSSLPAGLVTPSEAGGRWLDLTLVRNSIRSRIAKLKEGVAPAALQLGEDLSAEACDELLQHLYRHLTRGPQPRVHPRRSAHGEVQLVSGFAGIHYHVSGKVFREPGTTSTISRQHAVELATFGRMSTSEDELRASREFGIEAWHQIDQSPGGLRIARELGTPGRRIGAGQLLALKMPGDASFSLAVTRWLVATGQGEVHAGIMWIPGAPLGTTARSVELAGREQFERAFVLPEVPRLNVPASLILPLNSFRGPHEVELIMPSVGRMQLTRLLHRGLDYDRVEFQALE